MGTTTTSRLNQEQAAAALEVTVKTLRTWETKPWFPKRGRTKAGYDVAAIAAARPKSDRDRIDVEESPLRQQARQAEHVTTIETARRAKLRRETEEIKLRKEEGALIPRHGVEQSYADLLTGVADWCAQLPDAYVSMLPVPQKYHRACRDLLRQLIQQKQHDLADELQAKALARDRQSLQTQA